MDIKGTFSMCGFRCFIAAAMNRTPIQYSAQEFCWILYMQWSSQFQALTQRLLHTILEKNKFPDLPLVHAIDALIKSGCPCEIIGFGEGRRVRFMVMQGLILVVGSSQSSWHCSFPFQYSSSCCQNGLHFLSSPWVTARTLDCLTAPDHSLSFK